MRGYNVIAVFNQKADRMLMCKRKKAPYQGLRNFVGGKIEEGEEHLPAAYRELREETGITEKDIKLTHLMDLTYYLSDCYIEIYVGRVNKETEVKGEENELFWSALDENFFDSTRYAGDGNIGHIMAHIEQNKDILFK